MNPVYFSHEQFICSEEIDFPFVVKPRLPMDLILWSQENHEKVISAIKHYGAVVFSGFDLKQKDFREVFTAITGSSPKAYKGDTPRDVVEGEIYKSTAVSDGEMIPLHQEVSCGDRKDMPAHIAFFCVTPSDKGTGQTLVGKASLVTEAIKKTRPELWQKMCDNTLTYTARYLPSSGMRTQWIQALNPSHATIEKRFGTSDPQLIEAQCQKDGLTCKWNDDWVTVSRSGVPATIQIEGITLFCNQIHLDILSPKLCGSWLLYGAAKTLLYPTNESTQFDVSFDDGTEITTDDASFLLTTLEQYQTGRDWEAGDLMIIDNLTTLHGKTPHSGPREIIVAMNGSAI